MACTHRDPANDAERTAGSRLARSQVDRRWNAARGRVCTAHDGRYRARPWSIERTTTENGAEAHMLVVPARDDTQEKAFRALFDRADLYGELVQSVKEV